MRCWICSSRRNAQTAKKLIVKLLTKHGFAPSRVVTDRLRSYPAAFRAIGLTAEHDRGLRANNRAENSHQLIRCRERKLQRFKSPGSAQTFPRHPCRHIQRIHPSTSSAAPTAFQGASRRFIPHLVRSIRRCMTPVARYIHRN
ncbi:MAG: IS6 family transposase [Alphaproteobacteria bacterium]|nr:IS6 family transposase [Alphaproteobacteria bacterium]MBM4264921.1 IS6 family transposase [Deltaproteobacteria bacterium]